MHYSLTAGARVLALLLVAACTDRPGPAGQPEAVDSSETPIAMRDSRPMPMPFTPPPGAIFAVTQRDGYRSFSTFAVVDSSGRLTDPPSDRTAKDGTTFIKSYLQAGARYAAMHGGRHIGWLVVDSAIDASCVGIGAEVHWSLGPDSLAGVSGLAFGQPRPEWGLTRAPTEPEDSTARAAVVALLREQGLGDDYLAELVWDSIVVVLRPGGLESVVAAAEVHVDPEDELTEWAFVVVEGTGDAARVRYAAFRGAPGWEYGRPALFDVEDIDGDRIPEIVLETLFYEGWSFDILRRADEEWQMVYSGGGGGC